MEYIFCPILSRSNLRLTYPIPWNCYETTAVIRTGFPRGIGSIEKVLNCEISFQDLEKVLSLSKMYIKN